MKPKVIGLCGRIGAGKTTVATLLQAKGYTVVSFAEPLKNMLLALGVPHKNLYGTQEQKLEPLALLGGRSARYAAQTLGTEWGREIIDGDLWINAWTARAREQLAYGKAVVVDDARFSNEIEAVRKIGGVSIRVIRPDLPPDPAAHASEQSGSLRVNYELLNAGTPEMLRLALDRLFEIHSQKLVAAE